MDGSDVNPARGNSTQHFGHAACSLTRGVARDERSRSDDRRTAYEHCRFAQGLDLGVWGSSEPLKWSTLQLQTLHAGVCRSSKPPRAPEGGRNDAVLRLAPWPHRTLVERRMCAHIAHLQKAHGGSSHPRGFDYTIPNGQPFISVASKQASSNSQQQWHLVPQATLQPLISMC